jgi:glutathione S-transferase
MSYSRWKDDRFWPLFRDAVLRTHPNVTAESLETARKYNFRRYHFQGIGRYEPDAAYARGVADLQVLANLLPARGFLFGAKPSSIDAAIYGFTANIYSYEIDTLLKEFLTSQPNLVLHCQSVHAALEG